VHCPTFSSFQCNNGSTILARCSWALPYDFVPFQPTQYTETTTNIDRLKMDFECRLIKCLQTPLSLIFRIKPTKAEGPLVPFYILIRIHQRLWIDKPPQQQQRNETGNRRRTSLSQLATCTIAVWLATSSTELVHDKEAVSYCNTLFICVSRVR
jgi:hypothetical protein